jgi:uncharacterized protein YecE (DUF72 family)
LKSDANRPLRHALEVRHPSFETGEFISLLRKHGIALVVADTAGKWPLIREVTSDLIYVRLHGDKELYASGYSDAVLREWDQRIRAWNMGLDAPDATHLGPPVDRRPGGRDVLVYFDNDVKTHAPFDAMKLSHMLGLGPPAPARPVLSDQQFEPVRTTWSDWGARRGRTVADRTANPPRDRATKRSIKLKEDS